MTAIKTHISVSDIMKPLLEERELTIDDILREQKILMFCLSQIQKKIQDTNMVYSLTSQESELVSRLN